MIDMESNALTIEQQDWMRFLTSDGLAEKAGCTSNDFAKMVVKELADNAADMGGFGFNIDEEHQTITMWNSGDGLSEEQVHTLFNIKRPLTSTKHWRRGNRGALGNGLRAALAGCRICRIALTVISQGKQHEIELQDNGDVVITSTDHAGAEHSTVILLGFPVDVPFFSYKYRAYMDVQKVTQGQTVTDGKPMISWFKAEDINIMVQSLGDVSLGVFTEQFNVSGDLRDLDLSNSVQSVPTEEIMALLKANQGKTKINAIGKDTFAGDYKKVEGIHRDGDADIPFIIEAWATAVDAEKNNGDHTIEVITNRSLTLSRATLEVKSGRAAISSGGWVMRHRGKGQCSQTKAYSVILAVSSPYIPIVSSGKEPNLLDGTYETEIIDVLQSTMKKAGAAFKVPKTKLNLRQAANLCLEDAYRKVSNNGQYWANARQLMYAARPMMLELTGLTSFTDGYFTGTLLPQFLQDHPTLTDRWKVAYDKRGAVIQPHTGQSVGLGTIDIDRMTSQFKLEPMSKLTSFNYTNASPEMRFSGVLFVEKEGFNQAIIESGLLERYDIALASTKGNSVVALRVLLDEMVTRNPDFKVFTMTDFDISGASIRTTLTKDNELRYVFKNNIKTIPVCVSWEQARDLHELGLSEPVKLDPKMDLEEKFKFLLFENNVDRNGVRFLLHNQRRVEINALTTAEILGLIQDAFERHGTKVLPDQEHLEGAWKEQLLAARLEVAEASLRKELSTVPMPDDLSDHVEAILQADPSKSWDQAVREVAAKVNL
jgi:hypothetical protein